MKYRNPITQIFLKIVRVISRNRIVYKVLATSAIAQLGGSIADKDIFTWVGITLALIGILAYFMQLIAERVKERHRVYSMGGGIDRLDNFRAQHFLSFGVSQVYDRVLRHEWPVLTSRDSMKLDPESEQLFKDKQSWCENLKEHIVRYDHPRVLEYSFGLYDIVDTIKGYLSDAPLSPTDLKMFHHHEARELIYKARKEVFSLREQLNDIRNSAYRQFRLVTFCQNCQSEIGTLLRDISSNPYDIKIFAYDLLWRDQNGIDHLKQRLITRYRLSVNKAEEFIDEMYSSLDDLTATQMKSWLWASKQLKFLKGYPFQRGVQLLIRYDPDYATGKLGIDPVHDDLSYIDVSAKIKNGESKRIENLISDLEVFNNFYHNGRFQHSADAQRAVRTSFHANRYGLKNSLLAYVGRNKGQHKEIERTIERIAQNDVEFISERLRQLRLSATLARIDVDVYLALFRPLFGEAKYSVIN